MDKDTAKLSETIDELETNLYTVASALRLSEAQNIVETNVIISMASGLIPVPLFDIISLTNIQFHMIQTLAEHYEIPADNINKSLITSLISGSLPAVSILGLGSVIKSIPGIGSLAGSGSVSIISGAISYAVGQVFIRHFQQGGTLDDFEPASAKEYFSEQLKAGKLIASELIQEIKQKKQQKDDKLSDSETT
ncbi:MAG: YcjF family protein [gamma proteobacterium symbiont of Taylorina sp.]|nr:YcjF family protein [gamma proteobacterium symbiont of Taylorina sp.]